MSNYLLGLATLPAAGAVLALLRFVASNARDWWTAYGPGFNQDDNNIAWRSRTAAALVLARRFFMVRLPGGLVPVYRSAGASKEARGSRAQSEDMGHLPWAIAEATRSLGEPDSR